MNFIDGVWSSCGEERIIVFTNNHKEKLKELDPALLHKDVHVHMSYLTMDGFKQLVSNYLGINGDHQLFQVIEALLKNKQVTLAELLRNFWRVKILMLLFEESSNFSSKSN